MIKKLSGIILLFLLPLIGFCQNSIVDKQVSERNSGTILNLSNQPPIQEPVSRISLSVNLMGFAMYGPVTNIEFGIQEDVVINVHLRFPEYGLLSHRSRFHTDGLDDLGGITVGGGLIKFFGNNRNRPFGGILFEYDQISTLYGQHKYWEWAKAETSARYLFNLGYRFNFRKRIFVNTGVFIGVSKGGFEWEYSDLSFGYGDPTPREGTFIEPFGMLDLTVGIGF